MDSGFFVSGFLLMYLYPFFVSNAAMVFGSKVLIQEVEKIPQKKYKKSTTTTNVPKNAQKSTQRCTSKICKDCVDC